MVLYFRPEKLVLCPSQALNELLERMEVADMVGLDSFGTGEHHCENFLDAAPTMILAAAASHQTN